MCVGFHSTIVCGSKTEDVFLKELHESTIGRGPYCNFRYLSETVTKANADLLINESLGSNSNLLLLRIGRKSAMRRGALLGVEGGVYTLGAFVVGFF